MKRRKKEESNQTKKQNPPMIISTKKYTKRKKKKTDRQNPRTNGKSKAIQTKSHKEGYTYTLTKREGKKCMYLYIKKSKKEESNQINKQIYQ